MPLAKRNYDSFEDFKHYVAYTVLIRFEFGWRNFAFNDDDRFIHLVVYVEE